MCARERCLRTRKGKGTVSWIPGNASSLTGRISWVPVILFLVPGRNSLVPEAFPGVRKSFPGFQGASHDGQGGGGGGAFGVRDC